jgi:two-component system, chemotaxis family, protein-glutamate methylesterase/glutaminase
MGEIKHVVVIGASAGGVNSILEVVSQLDKDMKLAVFIVLHLNEHTLMGHLVDRIQRYTPLTCKLGEHNEQIQSGFIYLAVPEKHMLVNEGRIILGEGPAETRWRPSIDVLFRSAAAHYDSMTIGIILTGLMQDGTAGMVAIKRCGGVTIVQDPEEAEFSEMPNYVLRTMKVDYCVRTEEMGTIIREVTNNDVTKHDIPEDIRLESAIAERTAVSIDDVRALGVYAETSCPDCGGGLWQMNNDHLLRFRCHTGHTYTADELLNKQRHSLENTLWVALRMMEERRNLLRKMAEDELNRGWIKSASSKAKRQAELELHIEKLRVLLFDSKNN